MIDNLYSALKRRRCGRAVTSESGSCRAVDGGAPAALPASPLRSEAAHGAEEVLVLLVLIKVRFLSPPYSNCPGSTCLTHVGTEGPARRQPALMNRTADHEGQVPMSLNKAFLRDTARAKTRGVDAQVRRDHAVSKQASPTRLICWCRESNMVEFGSRTIDDGRELFQLDAGCPYLALLHARQIVNTPRRCVAIGLAQPQHITHEAFRRMWRRVP